MGEPQVKKRRLFGFLSRNEPERSTDLLSFDDLASLFQYQGLTYPVINQTLGANSADEIGADFQSLVQGAYSRNGPIWTCVMVRQLLFQEARFQFRRYKSGRPGEYFGTRDLLPLENPWPNATTGDLLARAIQDVDLAGNWYGVRIGNEIRRLRPDYVTIVLGSKVDPDHAGVAPDSTPIGYVYNPPSGDSQFYLPEEVAHFAPYPDPQANYRGMSWLTPVINEIRGDLAATQHKLKFFEQGATPNLIVSFDPAVDSDTVSKWVEAMEDKIGGAANAYRTLYLGGGADAKAVGANMRDAALKDVQGAGETRIAAAAGVPPIVAGFSEGLASATYSNYSQARRRFADGTMRPLWRNFAGSISSIIRVPNGADLWYDDRDIPFLREDESERATIQQTQAGAINTLVAAGYDPDSVIDAIDAGDWQRLKHTGLTSVQLLPPGQSNSTGGTAPPEAPRMALPAPSEERSKRKDANPPGEADLRAIAKRFTEAEAHVRSLLAQSLDGNSEALKAEALHTIEALRGEKADEALGVAYAHAFDKAVAKIEEKAATTDPIGGLAKSLTDKLTSAVDRAKRGTRKAFDEVTSDNLDEMAAEAVTGHVDEAGRAWSIASYASMAISTIGRRATSRGIRDAVGDGQVEVSSHGSTHPICSELEGQVFPAATAPEPPYHEGCQHMLIPV